LFFLLPVQGEKTDILRSKCNRTVVKKANEQTNNRLYVFFKKQTQPIVTMAAAFNIEKPEQPQLAKHDSSILGKILLE